MDRQSRKSELISFLVISYGYLWLLFGIARLFDIPFSYDPRELGGMLVLVGIPASLVSATLVTLGTGEKGDLRRFFERSLNWRLAPQWYLASALLPLLVVLASTMAAIGFDRAEIASDWFSPSMPLGYMVFLLIYIGVGEEIGWRGFALPRFQDGLGPLGGSIATGVVWACWHLPLFLMPGSSQYGEPLIGFVLLVTCWTIPMALFVGRSRGSVLPAILTHASVNLAAFALRYPHTYVLQFWGIAAIVAAIFLSKPRRAFGEDSVLIDHPAA